MRIAIAILLMLACFLWSCFDRVELRREEQDRAWKSSRCEPKCGGAFHDCITDKRSHAPGACSEHYNTCIRECQ